MAQILSEIMDKIPDRFNIADMMARVEDKNPYVIVAFQECERMNILMGEIRRSLMELKLGLKVLSLTYLLYHSKLCTNLL